MAGCDGSVSHLVMVPVMQSAALFEAQMRRWDCDLASPHQATHDLNLEPQWVLADSLRAAAAAAAVHAAAAAAAAEWAEQHVGGGKGVRTAAMRPSCTSSRPCKALALQWSVRCLSMEVKLLAEGSDREER
ncbi:MAG: hypothetical protein FRX49_05204 [Trebouxia sp. A1-2]|nr:MAG: hypothetical protein FRX49_05204 [Trebouxia sp. A1-2]